ncbi:MAG: hypothetical protein ACR2LC_13730 [Pyrinomonadaceae bacterium]
MTFKTYSNYIVKTLASLLLIACFGTATIFADTIRLKDGSVIRGEIVGFRDQQFTVLIGAGTRGRRSRITLYMEDVDSIEFDSTAADARGNGNDNAAGNDANTGNNNTGSNTTTTQTTTTVRQGGNTFPSDTGTNGNTAQQQQDERVTTLPSRTQGAPTFFQINTRVRADNSTNGWTNSGLVVRRGQRIRINASGRVSLGQGRYSTPAGLPTLPDRDKLMRNEPTGVLIAVVGDNNDDFITVGRSREFTAQREGVLFLGVNEGNLTDNSGTYDVVIEAEATTGASTTAP